MYQITSIDSILKRQLKEMNHFIPPEAEQATRYQE